MEQYMPVAFLDFFIVLFLGDVNMSGKPKLYILALILICAIVLTISAKDTGYSYTEDEAPYLAELHGKFDLFSSANVTVVIELKERSFLASKLNGENILEQDVQHKVSAAKQLIEEQMDGIDVKRTYHYVMAGFSAELQSNKVPQLLAMPGVKAVYQNAEYTVPTNESVGEALEYRSEVNDYATFIGVDQVREENGATGKGVKVAILDTGVDYTHPDLVHAFGDYKGWDLLDDHDDPVETRGGSNGDNRTYYGTYMAGIIAGQGKIEGVAPEATLLAYRVIRQNGLGNTADILAGIEKALQDDAHIITLSAEISNGYTDAILQKVFHQSRLEDVLIVTSSKNKFVTADITDNEYERTPILSVAASHLPYHIFRSKLSTLEGNEYHSVRVMGYKSMTDLTHLNQQRYEIVYIGKGDSRHVDGDLNLEGKVALIERGRIPFLDKVNFAYEAGAVAAIIYNDDEGTMNFNVPGMPIPTFQLSAQDGQSLLQEISNGDTHVNLFTEKLIEIDETMPRISNRGNAQDAWDTKPDVVAPGVGITSTVPSRSGDTEYITFDGTGASVAQVSGAVALVKQSHPSLDNSEIKWALKNTANQVNSARGLPYDYTVQGAGSIRVADALNSGTLVNPESYSFGIFTNSEKTYHETQHFTIQNITDESKNYEISVEFDGHPQVITVEPQQVEIKAQSKAQVTMDVHVHTKEMRSGHYQGKILVTDGEIEIEVPSILYIEDDHPDEEMADFSVNHHKGTYTFDVYLPQGADNVQFWIYQEGNPLHYIGDGGSFSAAAEGANSYSWEGIKLDEDISSVGDYHVFVHAEKEGRSHIIHGGTLRLDND